MQFKMQAKRLLRPAGNLRDARAMLQHTANGGMQVCLERFLSADEGEAM